MSFQQITVIQGVYRALALAVFISGCSSTEAKFDPKRCTPVNIGEATEIAQNPAIADDRMVIVEGLTDPRGLMWQDAKNSRTYLITRVLGTEQRLYYISEVKPGKTPSVLSSIKGHLRRFDHLPKELANAIVAGLKSEYKIEIDPGTSYLVDGSTLPKGCAKTGAKKSTQ